MGYYVSIIDHNLFIDKKHFGAIYDKMCELNDHDELKRGGGGPVRESYEGRYNPNKWFSWMDYNYPETCSNLQEILNQIGFDIQYDDYGNIAGLSYDNKTGNEDYFLACFAGFVPNGNYIEFLGEETNDYYRFYYIDNKCLLQRANVEVSYGDSQEELIPGQITEGDKRANEYMERFRKELAEKNAN